ncbi:MAG TPA: NAD-dependent epimerase/dehydratase family protein [Flavisolibacter sp.]|nr:NAD-dependent epimerase/dehydratase family protein [Flavisolibacter sp.]
MNRVIGITGAGGFIGSHLKIFLESKGYTVISFVRHPANDNDRIFDLRSQVDPALLKDVEVLVHCAFIRQDSNLDAEVLNVRAAENLKRAAQIAGVRKTIFFSSLSAHPGARSSYGRSKLNIEKIFSEKHDVILKCGLVIGNGGLFREMLNFALNKKLVPLIDGGAQPVQFISMNDVALAVHHIISDDLCGSFVLAYPQSMPYRKFFEAIGNHFNTRLKFVRLSSRLVHAVLSVAAFAHVRLPVSKENLYGLESMREWRSDGSMDQLRLSSKSLAELLHIHFSTDRS